MDYVKGTMLPGMNIRLPEGDPHVLEHELFKWLGMWLVKMSPPTLSHPKPLDELML